MVLGLNSQTQQHGLGTPGQINSSVENMPVNAPNEQALAKQAFQQLVEADSIIQNGSITLLTTDKQAGSVGIIRQNNTLRAFVSGNEKDQKGFKMADVVDFTSDAESKDVTVKAYETSKEGGTLVNEKAVDPVVLKAIVKHVKPDAQIKSVSLEETAKPAVKDGQPPSAQPENEAELA